MTANVKNGFTLLITLKHCLANDYEILTRKKNQSMQTTHNVNAPSLCPNALRAILRHETHKWTRKATQLFASNLIVLVTCTVQLRESKFEQSNDI